MGIRQAGLKPRPPRPRCLFDLFEDHIASRRRESPHRRLRGQHGWHWRVVEVASTGSWRKFVSKVREKGYSLAILVQKTTCVDRSGESSHAVVEETPLEGGQAENVWRTEQGRGEEVVEGNTQGEVIVRGTNREANDSDDEEPDSPMRVDAAEENEAVVDQMEVENEEYIALVVEGEDTTLWDNETNIPDDWTTISMSRMKVNDGLDAYWCYDSKQVKVGQMFHDKGHLQDAVKRWAFVQKREFRVKVSNRTTYDVKCIQGGCPWRVHGYKPQHDTLWVASRVEQHTCLLENTHLVHRNLTAAFVAQMVYSKVVRKTSLSPFTIMHDVEKEYGSEISYDKAWRAKQKALEMWFGTYEDSYHNLPPLLEVKQPMVQEWEHAADNLALQTPPDDGSYYGAYLRWYRSVTRWRCFPPQRDSTVPHQAAITDTFAPQPRSAYNSMAEFVEHVHVESDTLLQRLEARPPVVRPDDVARVLRNFRARAAALLRRVSYRSAADVVQTSGRRPSPPLPRRSSVDRSGPSSSRRGYEAAHTSHDRPSFQLTPAPEYTRGSAGSGVPTSSTAPPRPQVFQTPPYVQPTQGASGSAHFPYMPTGDNVLNTPAWGLHITPRAPEQGHTQHTYDEYGSASTHHGMPAYSPRTAFIEDFFSTDPPHGEVGMDYWHAAPQVTQPTQETEAGQGPEVTPQQAARDRHPPDNLTYPTEQIRHRKKGGPNKRAKGTDRP
uniref:Transposable element protein, putative, MuDR n=2 Tax=Oryza sativa subsp. japonica TaxID=39947 RepID=Q53KG8_ORYSJ|nr:Transposable element protein, putative [Oryza sativa Japonica Group]ABA93350.1 Transposable element protein, putative, MuDR [Oryza sativa Japonica Group]